MNSCAKRIFNIAMPKGLDQRVPRLYQTWLSWPSVLNLLQLQLALSSNCHDRPGLFLSMTPRSRLLPCKSHESVMSTGNKIIFINTLTYSTESKKLATNNVYHRCHDIKMSTDRSLVLFVCNFLEKSWIIQVRKHARHLPWF